jgi:hypothetical protein
MRTKLAAVVIGLGLFIMPVAMSAHHAFSAEFDATKHLQFTGVLTSMEWVNPHVWIHVDVKMPDGSVQNWAVEGGTPSALYRRGLTKQNLPVGTEIIIDGYQAKDGSNRMNGRDLKLADGKAFYLGSSGTGAPGDPAASTNKK